MNLDKFQCRSKIFFVLLLISASDSFANDWKQKDFKIEGGGILQLEYPDSWGKKPAYNVYDDVTDLQFGPFGPREKPLFLVHLVSILALEPLSDDDLHKVTDLEIDNFREMAFETDIPVNDLDGPNMDALYFSITDNEPKRGEFDYLTAAIVRSGRLLIKCYFLSSRGAPEFGADAKRMMQSIKYTAPVLKPENEKEKKKK